MDLVVREAEAVEGAGPVVLDEDVGVVEEPPQEIPPPGVLHVQSDSALASVDGQEVGALALHKGRSPPSGVVALLAFFDLDDVRPRVRQGLCAIRPRQNPRQIDDLDPLQRAFGHSPILCGLCASLRPLR